MSNFIAFNNPFNHPLHLLGLELVVIGSFALTLKHALGRYRAGERRHLFQWLVALFYGLWMELLAFNYLNNYEHAQFTIQLYKHLLPLYVMCLYPVFHYTGLKLVERFQLGIVSEALLVGFAICLLDIPFDIVGVDARWWVWSSADPKLAVRWLGVPVTSYYWYLIFGAVYAVLCRLLANKTLWITPLIGAATIVLGTLAFMPFHGFKALGAHDSWIVAAQLALCAGLALRRYSPGALPLDRELVLVPLALDAFHLAVLLVLWSKGEVGSAPIKLGVITLVSVATVLFAVPARAAPNLLGNSRKSAA
jgi:hypothetical protein